MNKIDRQQVIVDLYKQGVSVKDIGSQLNMGQSTVYTWLKKAGVKTKTQAEAATKYTFNKRFFKNIDSEEKAYWLGFIYADGCISKPKNKSPFLQIAIKRTDQNHLYKLKDSIGFTGPILETKTNDSLQCRIRLIDTDLVNDLQSWGIEYRKSLTCTYPNIPVEYERDFIRGYFDGDGGISKNNTEITIAGTEDFLNNIQNVFNKILGTTITKLYKRDNIFQYTKHGRLQVTHILKWLYEDATIYLDRKYNLFKVL